MKKLYGFGYDDGNYSELDLFNAKKVKTVKEAVALLKSFFKIEVDEYKNSYFITEENQNGVRNR